jgi:hypothetical protein
MKKIVFDLSSLYWDSDDYSKNEYKYLELSDKIIDFFDIIKNYPAKFLLRQELFDLIQLKLPYTFKQHPLSYVLPKLFADYIFPNHISYVSNSTFSIDTQPNQIKNYFDNQTKEELNYLFYEIHFNSDNILFLTYSTLWNNSAQLKTVVERDEKIHATVVFKKDQDILSHFSQFKRIFKPNPKHKTEVYYDTERQEHVAAWIYDDITSQKLLDNAIKSENDEKKFYNFDTEINEFLVFPNTINEEYHGYMEKKIYSTKIPNDIKKHFLK